MSFSETAAVLKIEMEYEYDGVCLHVIKNTKFNNQKFKRKDLHNDPSFFVLHPDTIDSVYQLSSIGEVIRIPSLTTNYFKFNLEKGQYGLYATDEIGTGTGNWIDDWALNAVRIKLFNEKNEEIPVGMGMEESHENFPQRTFYISQPGTYYLCAVSNTSIDDMDICLNKLNYDTIGFETIQEVPTSYKGKIEGEYDFDLFTINVKKEEVLIFKNTGQTPIPMIIRNDEGYTPPASKNKIQDQKIVKLNEGENKFIVCSNFSSSKEPFEYEFTTQKCVLENGYEENYEDLKKVTTEFSDLTYIVGHSLPNPRLAFEVEKKSIIDFSFEMDGTPQNGVYANVLDLEGHRYHPIEKNIFELDSGKYIVEISSYSDFDECQVKYTATEIEDKEINVILEESSLSKFFSDDFPSVTAQNVGRTQKVKYNFTLNEDILIAFDSSVKIYQKDGTPVFYFGDNQYRTVYLTQGEYYYLIEGTGSYYHNSSNTYKIGIVNDKLETTSSPSQMKEIKIAEKLVLKKDWERDEDYLILHIEEDGFYHFNHTVEIYSEDFNHLAYVHDIVLLKAGTYYLIYSHDSSAEVNQEVSIEITKE